MKEKFMKNKTIAKAVTMLTAAYYGNMAVYCDDAFEAAETGLGNLMDKLWGVASKLLPVAIAICIISLFITHNEKNIESEKRVLIAMCVAFALLWLIHTRAGIITDTVSTLFGN